ncbi:MAG: CtsR family transcriptional regulator [Ruminococcaceae bacterium]|nr:CtsR family transcriptional regulator [Oscillospiraceae bacterium]
MMAISDIIERYIKELLNNESEVEIKRNDLAAYFNCVPSQINYVISTRFTNEHGFIVESRRGGGGGITIRRVTLNESDYITTLINSIGNFLKQSDAYSYIKALYEYGKITKREANIMFAAVSDTTLNTDAQLKDYLRARILKNILINLKRS